MVGEDITAGAMAGTEEGIMAGEAGMVGMAVDITVGEVVTINTK
jgi:hypothetical protein